MKIHFFCKLIIFFLLFINQFFFLQTTTTPASLIPTICGSNAGQHGESEIQKLVACA